MSKYRVLTIDGGGIRGLITTIMLQLLLVHPGLESLLESINLIAGTSTGGLLFLGIAHQVDLAAIRDVYIKKGPEIFDDSWLDDLVDLGKIALLELLTISAARYSIPDTIALPLCSPRR